MDQMRFHLEEIFLKNRTKTIPSRKQKKLNLIKNYKYSLILLHNLSRKDRMKNDQKLFSNELLKDQRNKKKLCLGYKRDREEFFKKN